MVEVIGSEKVIMDKHSKAFAPKHLDTKFIKLDAENAIFFVTKLAIKTLPCVIIFRKGIAVDSLFGFQGLEEKNNVVTETQTISLKCAAYGVVFDVDMRDKITTFILKNPSEAKKSSKDKKATRRAEKERLKEGKAADEELKKIKKKRQRRKVPLLLQKLLFPKVQ